MTEENQLVVAKAKLAKGFSPAMFSKVKGLSENSPLRKIADSGELRLTVDGNQFQTKKGSKVIQTLKDGKRPLKELDVVIHHISPVIQYQLIEPYDPKNPMFRPLGCWSNDGRKPDENVWNKQSSSCDTCKHGGNGDRTCGMTRLAVVSLYSPTDVPKIPMLMNFNWSSNSTKKPGEDQDENLFGLINYLKFLKVNEVETHRVVTRLTIDDFSDSKNNCKLLFSPVDIVQDGDANRIAHENWSEGDEYDLDEMIRISQRKPLEEGSAGGDAGAPVKKQAAEKKTEPVKKRAAKKKPEPEPVEEEEEDLDDLEDFDETDETDEPDDEPDDEDEEVEAEEDDDDFGDLEDLLDEDED